MSHAPVWGLGSNEEHTCAVVKAPDSIHAAYDGQFAERGVVRAAGHLLVDGLEPWAEFNWIDKMIRIGDVHFRGARRIRRCAATEVNLDTGVRDIALYAVDSVDA